MQAEVGRLNAIVDRFLSLARPSRLTLAEEPLAPVLEKLSTLLSTQASAQKIQVVTDLTLEGARVRMDRQQLTTAFMNLLLNAIQAMPDGGTLTVRGKVISDFGSRISDSAIRPASAGQSAIVIEVKDTGSGIAPEHLDRIFEPYFTTKEGGTGLGLALAHKIIQEHGGRLDVESRVGPGAVFAVTLPVAEST
jgi:two-component system sensor histidine kinase HydH